MPGFKVFGQQDSNLLRLRLDQDSDESVTLAVVDADGDVASYLFTFEADGRIVACGGVDAELGLELDDQGAVEIYTEE